MTQDFEYKGMVDTGALVDTAVAQRAGIGFIGKNEEVRVVRISGARVFVEKNN